MRLSSAEPRLLSWCRCDCILFSVFSVGELLGRHRDAKRDLDIELQRIGKQHKFPDVEVCVKQLVLARNAEIRAALQDRMLREQLDEETMDEEEVETLMLSIEYWAEKSKVSGYAQPVSQQHQTPPRQQASGGGEKEEEKAKEEG